MATDAHHCPICESPAPLLADTGLCAACSALEPLVRHFSEGRRREAENAK